MKKEKELKEIIKKIEKNEQLFEQFLPNELLLLVSAFCQKNNESIYSFIRRAVLREMIISEKKVMKNEELHWKF